jgi:hypothetical protein
MRRSLALLATIAFVASLAGAADAAPCKDAKGKFIKCPTPAAGPCRDKKTLKFAKCGAPGTEAVPMKKK